MTDTAPRAATRRATTATAPAAPASSSSSSSAGYAPTIPPKVRDAAYIAGLAVTACTGLVTGLVGVWAPDYAAQAAQTGNIVLTAAGVVIGGLGVVYRPGRQLS